MEKFYLDSFLAEGGRSKTNNSLSFESLCMLINLEFQREWEDEKENIQRMIAIQKNAIIGYEKEVSFFKNKIKVFIKKRNVEGTRYPTWYRSLDDAVYHENWGLAGIGEWFAPGYENSSSCKVIGERIYFQEKGEMVLKPQRISESRREQLIRAFLLLMPEERLDKDFLEIYTLDGTRITIFRGGSVKTGQDVMVFRRYIIPTYTFEEQARRGTIPYESIPLFKEMVKLGFNVAVTGAMKSAKTSFLATWQSYEDPCLEGLMLETDPEISLHNLMPTAPIVQILAKEEKLKTVTSHLLRSDADYLIMAEARDGIALDTVLRIASKGTRRLKITFHERNPMDFPYDVAAEIVLSLGGNPELIAKRVAGSFDYVFHFIQLKDKSKKRLKGIYEISFDKLMGNIKIVPICSYQHRGDGWKWFYEISSDKELAGREEDEESYEKYIYLLSQLAESTKVSRADN